MSNVLMVLVIGRNPVVDDATALKGFRALLHVSEASKYPSFDLVEKTVKTPEIQTKDH
jgi:hypothetical protein